MYKGEGSSRQIGSGSTADAIRNEIQTGDSTEGLFHSQKGQENINALRNWLKEMPDAPDNDKIIANALKQDLIDALVGK